MTTVADVLAVNYLMRQPTTEDEAERVIHALHLANYEIRKRPPHPPAEGHGVVNQGRAKRRKQALAPRVIGADPDPSTVAIGPEEGGSAHA